jgi:predicted ATPase
MKGDQRMLTKLEVDNFKSLQQFEISFSHPLTVLIGTNSVGKSTILQAIDLLSYFANGELENYLLKRNWEPSELRSKPFNAGSIYVSNGKAFVRFAKRNITFSSTFQLENNINIKWEFTLTPKKDELICTREVITDLDTSKKILHRETNKFRWFDYIKNENEHFPEIQLNASMLSLINLNQEDFSQRFPQLCALKKFVIGIKSFDLLTPDKMKKTSRNDAPDLGIGGERLAAFLHSLDSSKMEIINTKLKEYYSSFDKLVTSKKQYGYVQLQMKEKSLSHSSYLVNATYISDGLLRIIAIVSIGALSDHYQVLLFDEIEDGINPSLAAELVDNLKHIGQENQKQLFVTTHSPIMLNYFDKESIIFLWKNHSDGRIYARNMFSSPELLDQLDYMNPGEIWLNMDQHEIEVALNKTIDPSSGESDEP